MFIFFNDLVFMLFFMIFYDVFMFFYMIFVYDYFCFLGMKNKQQHKQKKLIKQ